MNTWFDLLPPETDVEVVAPGHLLHIFAGKLQPSKVLRGMDYPDKFSSKHLKLFRQLLIERIASEDSNQRISVVDRSTSNQFHSTEASESSPSGSLRRSVPNLAAWGFDRAASLDIDVDVFDAEKLVPTQQVQQVASSSVLLGQHGAGLSLMVFMQPGSSVVEIHPPLPQESQLIFRNLALACGHRYHQVPQAGLHANVDIDALDRKLKQALAENRTS